MNRNALWATNVAALSGGSAPRLLFVATRGRSPNIGTTSTATATVRRTHRLRYRVGKGGTSYLQLAYPGYWTNTTLSEANLANDYQIGAHVEVNGGALAVATWGGASLGTVPAGSAEYISDAISAASLGFPGGTIPEGTVLWILSERTVPVVGNVHLAGQVSSSPTITGEAGVSGAASGTTPATWVGVAGALASGGGWTGIADRFGPLAVIGEQATASPSAIIIGDSLAVGIEDNGGDGFNGGGGYVARAFAGLPVAYSYTNIANRGETATQFLSGTKRAAMYKYATHAILEHSTNDFSAGRSVAQVKADLNSIAAAVRAAGVTHVEVIQTLPRTTGAWTLADGSDQAYYDTGGLRAKRLQFNADLLTLSGLTGIDAYIDVHTGTITNGSDAEKWVANGTAAYATADGTHPSPAVSGLMAAPLTTRMATWTYP